MKTQIIYEDEELLVCRKPAGLATQGALAFQNDAVSELKNYLSIKSGNRNPYLGVIHRLDQPVEGLLVFAKTNQAAAMLNNQLSDGRLKKKYLAVLSKAPRKKQDLLIDYLKKEKNTAKVVPGKTPDAKRAELTYQILKETEGPALAEIEIRTGRFHQIRAQMAHMGCPLLGDQKYGNAAFGKENGGVRNVALCAYKLELVHPATGKKCQYEVRPENPAFRDFL